MSIHDQNSYKSPPTVSYVNGVVVDIIEMVVNWNSDFWEYQIKL
jgi:hypothetical protein